MIDYVAQDGSNNIAICADVADIDAMTSMLAAPPEVVAMEAHGVVQPPDGVHRVAVLSPTSVGCAASAWEPGVVGIEAQLKQAPDVLGLQRLPEAEPLAEAVTHAAAEELLSIVRPLRL